MARTTIRGAESYIARGEEFDAGNLYGGKRPRYFPGIMPDYLSRFYRDDMRQGLIDYVVYSYMTPIAWRRTDGTWKYPEVSYSPTTTRHQHVTRMALRGEEVTQPGGLKLDR